jgi:hypothetical protein
MNADSPFKINLQSLSSFKYKTKFQDDLIETSPHHTSPSKINNRNYSPTLKRNSLIYLEDDSFTFSMNQLSNSILLE